MKNRLTYIAYVLMVSLGLASPYYGTNWAIIIGINDYENENVSRLNYAENDATDVKNMFIDSFNFKDENIIFLLNQDATLNNILDAFDEVAEKSSKNDRVVFYFAGHGITMDLPSGGEKGYLVPYSGNPNKAYRTCLPMVEIKEISSMIAAKHMLFLVDACYGGLAAVNTRGLKKTVPNYLSKVTKASARQIITAGGRGEEVVEKSEWGHSAFTRNLLKGLGDGFADSNGDGVIFADELSIYLKKKVTEDSDGQHTPQSNRLTSDEGEVVFSLPIEKNEPLDNIQDPNMALLLSEIRDLKKQINTSDSNAGPSKEVQSESSLGDIATDESAATYVDSLEVQTVMGEDALGNIVNNAIKKSFIDPLKKINVTPKIFFDFNKVDGAFLGSGFGWHTDQKGLHLNTFFGYGLNSSRPSYNANLAMYIANTPSSKVGMTLNSYDKTYTTDSWKTQNVQEKSSGVRSTFLPFMMTGYDPCTYFQKQGASVNFMAEYINKYSNFKSAYLLSLFIEKRLPLESSITSNLMTRQSIKYNNTDINQGTFKGVRIAFSPSMQTVSNQGDIYQTFKYKAPDTIAVDSIYLVAQSSNFRAKQYKMEKKKNNLWETKEIALMPGLYYFTYRVNESATHVDSVYSNVFFSKKDSMLLSYKKVGVERMFGATLTKNADRKDIFGTFLQYIVEAQSFSIMYELGSIAWPDQYDGIYRGYGLLKEHYYLKVKMETGWNYYHSPSSRFSFKMFAEGHHNFDKDFNEIMMTHTMEVGGPGTIRGYRMNEFTTYSTNCTSFEYRRLISPGNELILFHDQSVILTKPLDNLFEASGFGDDKDEMEKNFKQYKVLESLGVGFSFRNRLELYVARNREGTWSAQASLGMNMGTNSLSFSAFE